DDCTSHRQNDLALAAQIDVDRSRSACGIVRLGVGEAREEIAGNQRTAMAGGCDDADGGALIDNIRGDHGQAALLDHVMAAFIGARLVHCQSGHWHFSSKNVGVMSGLPRERPGGRDDRYLDALPCRTRTLPPSSAMRPAT